MDSRAAKVAKDLEEPQRGGVAGRIRRVLTGRERWALAKRDAIDLLRLLPDRSVDAVIMDPPYGISYRAKRQGSIAQDKRPHVWAMGEVGRVVKPGGCVVCFCRWDVREAFVQAMTLAGLVIRSEAIWDRTYGGSGDCQRQFSPRHETMLFAPGPRFRFPNGRPDSVFSAPRVHYTRSEHPTEKSPKLMEWLVSYTTREGDLIVDPFAGSGSTGAAAVKLGRRFIGGDIERRWVALSKRRIKEATHD